MELSDIPGRVFLDTCTVNFILDYGAQIHDGATHPPNTCERDALDISALQLIFNHGQRMQWQLAISPHTYFEICNTRDTERLSALDFWFQELWQYWRSTIEYNDDLPTFVEAEDERVRFLGSGYFAVLPDVSDRVLLCDALVYRCDLFCTRDRSTIVKHREEFNGLPLEIVTPVEWWQRIKPYAAL